MHTTLMEISKSENLPFATVVIRLLNDCLKEKGYRLTPEEEEIKKEIQKEFEEPEYIQFLRALVRDEMRKDRLSKR